MIQLVRPQYFIPVHGGHLRRRYHADLAAENGVARSNILLSQNGDFVLIDSGKAVIAGTVSHGSVLVDTSGNTIGPIVVKDRLMLGEAGIVSVVLTIDGKTGRLLSSPDIISRGFVAMRDSESLMKDFRSELHRAVHQRFLRVDRDRFKVEIRDFISSFLFEQTSLSPIVIPVVNVIGKQPAAKAVHKSAESKTSHSTMQPKDDQTRFKEMRAKLLQQH
jgi:ribonuclease J